MSITSHPIMEICHLSFLNSFHFKAVPSTQHEEVLGVRGGGALRSAPLGGCEIDMDPWRTWAMNQSDPTLAWVTAASKPLPFSHT